MIHCFVYSIEIEAPRATVDDPGFLKGDSGFPKRPVCGNFQTDKHKKHGGGQGPRKGRSVGILKLRSKAKTWGVPKRQVCRNFYTDKQRNNCEGG